MSKKSKGNLNAGEVISKGVDISLSNLKNLGILAIIFQFIPMIITSLMGISFAVSTVRMVSEYHYKVSLFADISIILLLMAAIGIWTTLGNFASIKLIHKRNNNEEMTWREAMKFALSKVGKVILFMIFTFILVIVFSVALGLLGSIGTMIIAGLSKLSAFLGALLGILGVIGIIVIVICLTMYIIFMQQGIVIRELSVWESFKYSISMVNGRLFNVFTKELLVWIIAIIAGLVLNLLNLIPFIGPIIMIIGSVIIAIYETVCNTVIFDDYDQCHKNI